MSTVYLLHLHQPLSPHHTAQHYIGWTDDLIERLKKHLDGSSKARFMQVCAERQIPFSLARIWNGEGATRSFERRLKNYKHADRLCPICDSGALSRMSLKEDPCPSIL